MLKDAGDRVYTVVYWTLRGFIGRSLVGGMNVSFVVVDRWKCECVGR
jgi:hypothetical protein